MTLDTTGAEAPTEADAPALITWGTGGLEVDIEIGVAGTARLAAIRPASGADSAWLGSAPLVEIATTRAGRAFGPRMFETELGTRLVYRGHREGMVGERPELVVALLDEQTGLEVELHYLGLLGVPVLTASATVRNGGGAPITLLALTSFSAAASGWDPEATVVHRADSGWSSENRWFAQTVAEAAGVERASLRVRSTSTWSSSSHSPMGAVQSPDGLTLLWQIEHAGGWSWELGFDAGVHSIGMLGPSDEDHQWSRRLEHGEAFTLVPVTIALADGGLEPALDALTAYRRATRRWPPADRTLPVVYNDFMNTVLGAPDEQRTLSLIDAAARAGAEVFCVDAGWYSDIADWGDTMGAWEESRVRFPRGFRVVFDAIRARGMIPGLWLEPEVMGIDCVAADQLPDDAYFLRGGERLIEARRYLLDLRHPAARARLDAVLDRVIDDYGLGYVKLDYNVSPGAGTDAGAHSVGDGLLEYTRAHRDWLAALVERHPDLIVENCASGAMRADWSLLSLTATQSTSDQCDAFRSAPIVASAPMLMLPEQASNWVVPQPGMPEGERTSWFANGMLGRLLLSGHLDRMSPEELERVTATVAAYRELRQLLPVSVARWPLGLPARTDDEIALALVSDEAVLLSVWWRGSTPGIIDVPLGSLGLDGTVRASLVLADGCLQAWAADPDRNVLSLKFHEASAAVIRFDR
ncbi:MAG: alpha-galactosidase [Protaetiibacter sp.]